MSRIGKQTIEIPANVEVKLTGDLLTVKGPQGTLERKFLPAIVIDVKEQAINLQPQQENNFLRALWGTYAAHIQNMITGVTTGFTKKLLIEGVGYKYNASGDQVVLDIGLSHSVKVKIPAGLKVVTEKNVLTVSGCDKELVGQLAAKIRGYKPVEPYKGKGIRYEGEVVLRKQGKRSTATA